MPRRKKSPNEPFAVSIAVAENESLHEVEFTANVSSWINLILDKDPSLPFGEARCERRSQGSEKRRDLTLLDRDGRVLVTGEIKLPYRKDGATPYNALVVRDAREKAERAGADYFFTWNVNECALWETRTAHENPAAGQNYRTWKVALVIKESHLVLSSTEEAIKRWLGQFLNDLAAIFRGRLKVGYKPPDERFIDILEAALNIPIRLTQDELEKRYETVRVKADLDGWLREQGRVIRDDWEGIRDNLESAAKFACYALVNKLVFHEALLKRYGAQLDKLAVPEHITSGDELRLHLEGYFDIARKVTGDYETVFGEDHSSVGNRIPFYTDSAVDYWRGLIERIHEFDFSRLDYEVIGGIFERLIGPEERHKYGQFYTRVEVVDLINAFCLRNGDEAVLDPACGGGTFLVRAYVRKRELQPSRSHAKLLEEIYGVDISPFACHLTTINLATRDLIQDENYPRIARTDFFDVQPHRRFLSLPSHLKTKGLGKSQQRDIEIPPLDAVIGNPPYVRQEDIRSDRSKSKTPPPGTKEFYRKLAEEQGGVKLSGRSDLHCYFWPHAAAFLKPDGWLCLLTSSQWLDVEYGFRLQAWILARFKIVAVFESLHEPWFVGARVTTTATLLQRCHDPDERATNSVRFVQLRRPVAQILSHDGTTAGAVRAADDFRDEILGLAANTLNERYRARLVRQGDLLNDGIRLGRLMRGQAADDSDDAADEPAEPVGDYYGGKWGIQLRAPDLWFELMDRFSGRFAPLGELAEVRFGVKSGKDEFFYPRDASADCLSQLTEPAAFRQAFGVDRGEVESGGVKLVKCGENYGEIRPIEARYLEPEIHSLMEVKGYTVGPEDCGRLILLMHESRESLAGSHVLRYIEWGEEKGYHKGSTCAARTSAYREWYDLTGHERGAMLWPMAQQYKHSIPTNDEELIANHNLFDVSPKVGSPDVLAGILNSSWVVLSKFLFGRPVGNEGNLKTEVIDVKMMQVPNPERGSARSLNRVASAFAAMKSRDALQFLSEHRMRQMAYAKMGKESQLALLSDQCELDMPDRRALDNAVLELLGVTSAKEREALIERLYGYLREFFEQVRHKEERAIANKNRSKRKAAITPAEIAAQVMAELRDKHPALLKSYADFLESGQPFNTYELPATGEPELHADMFATDGSVRFLRGKKQMALVSAKTRDQAELLVAVAKSGVRGLVRVPLDAGHCRQLRSRYESFVENRQRLAKAMIAERSGDINIQEAVYSVVASMFT
jgi:methylase of polypeptide subunit release factors